MVLFAVNGAALAGVGVLHEQAESQFLSKAAKSLGDVTEIQTVPIDEQTNRYCAVVAFTPPSGKPVSFVNSACGTAELQRIGDRVPVLYDPAEPTHARIFQDAGSLGAWSAALPFLAWSLLSFIAAVVAALIVKRLSMLRPAASARRPAKPASSAR